MKKAKVLLVFAVLFVLCAVAFGAGSDPTQPLLGWQTAIASILLGVLSPYITGIYTRLHWSVAAKNGSFYAVCLILTVVGGLMTREITRDTLTNIDWGTFFVFLFTAGKVTYDWARPSVKFVAAAINPGDGGSANPT